jgi:hypothetical protein
LASASVGGTVAAECIGGNTEDKRQRGNEWLSRVASCGYIEISESGKGKTITRGAKFGAWCDLIDAAERAKNGDLA